jgi:hypothetical protein
LIFDDDHPSQVIAQRQQLTCEDKVKTVYYTILKGRALKPTQFASTMANVEAASFYISRQNWRQRTTNQTARNVIPYVLIALKKERR